MTQGCPDDDFFTKDLKLRVNSLDSTICATYSHDFLGGDVLVKRDALNRDFFTPVHALPNFTETTTGHDVLRILDLASD